MRGLLVVLMCTVVLISCADSGSSTIVEDDCKQQIEVIVNEYEEELNSLDREIDSLSSRLDEMTEKYMDLLAEEKPEVIVDTDDLLLVGDNIFRISSAGAKVLEDGLIIILECYEKDYSLRWIEVWKGIQVTELSIYSQPIIFKDTLYIVVDGNLNIISVETGETLKIVEEVGKSFSSTVIDVNGTIYTIGQYEPYVTAIDASGNILWQIRDEVLCYACEVEIVGNRLKVETLSGIFILTMDGNIESGPGVDDI